MTVFRALYLCVVLVVLLGDANPQRSGAQTRRSSWRFVPCGVARSVAPQVPQLRM